MARQQMSLEAALDEEMQDVMALLEGKKQSSTTTAARSSSAVTKARTASPAGAHQSPVRSMLDIAPGVPRTQHKETRRAASIAGLPSPSGSTFSDTPTVRSMLDYTAPPTRNPHRPSHGSTSPPALPTIPQGLPSPRVKPEDSYQFEMLPSIESHSMPKRVSQGGKKNKAGALSGVLGPDGRPSGKPTKSRSPAPGSHRSQSPIKSGNKFVSDSGKVINLNNAYRRLSDAALLKSGGRLASLPSHKATDVNRGEETAPDGGVRLTKDYNEDEALDSSDEDGGASSDDDWDAESRRGRDRIRKGSDVDPNSKHKVKSLLAAAEEESKLVHKQVIRGETIGTSTQVKAQETGVTSEEKVKTTYQGQQNQVRSLLDPEPSLTLTGPGGEKLNPLGKSQRGGPVPRTSFDAGGNSGVTTPMDSDEEQVRSDLKTARNMTLTLSPIHSTPSAHRCIRQILRGNYRQYQTEAEKGLRRQRMYLVATDLSGEAAYALEWTIGTVLRDGDTLLAVYAVDEEAVGATTGDATTSNSVGIGEGANQMKDAASIIRTLSNQEGLVVPGEAPRGKASSATGGRSASHARTSSTDARIMDKAERERQFATEEISERCVKLLRKTKLQVRVVVEVFHCKSPKQMITEVIDHLEPTLVILGSRGRSALKGVLLGSFSNYLVTKSSVPVMVARKKLRKHSKLKRTNLRLSNMLQNPGRRLEMAAIEKPSRTSYVSVSM